MGGKNDLLYLSTVRFLGSSRSPIYLRTDQDAFYFGFASRKVKEKDVTPSVSFGPRPWWEFFAVRSVVNVHLKQVYPKNELKSIGCLATESAR